MDDRTWGSWRVRACAAGLCVGAQVFLSGCTIGMPLALTGAWLCALPALPFAAWLCARSRRVLIGKGLSRTGYLLLALVLGISGAFALLSLVHFAAQTLAEQASVAWTGVVALLGVLLCALSGGMGVSRLSFALRYGLAVLVMGLSLAAMPVRVPVGLFPILGTGAMETGTAALAMLFGAAPALMLMLPPPELAEHSGKGEERRIPETGFFLARVLAGGVLGAALLFLTCASTTYEAIAENSEWGARLRMTAGEAPHEGSAQMLLITAKLLAIQLLAGNMVCAAEQALEQAFPMLKKRRAGLGMLLALLGISLAVSVLWGDAPVLFGVPLLAVPAALLAAFGGRGRQA